MPDEVGVNVPVGMDVSVIVVEPVPLSVPELDALAPVVTDAVGEEDTDRERLVVELGVIDDVAVFELVGVLVGVPLPVVLGETLELSEMLAVILELAPGVTAGVAEFDKDALGLSEMLGVTLALAPNVAEGVAVSVSVEVALRETRALWVQVPEATSAADAVGNELALVAESRVALDCVDGVATDALEKTPLTDAEIDGICVRVTSADAL